MAARKKPAGKRPFVLDRDPIRFAQVTAPGLVEGIVPRTCFVALFDVLGFKSLREERGGTQALHQLYVRHILPNVLHSAAGRDRIVRVGDQLQSWPDATAPLVEYRVFSDTVIFFTPGDDLADLVRITAASMSLLRRSFGGLRAPFRGAIGHGDLIADGAGIVVGSGLEDAYKAESSQAWAGCRLTNAAESRLLELREELLVAKIDPEPLLSAGGHVVEYDVPCCVRKPSGHEYPTEKALVLDWTRGMYVGAAGQSFNPPTDDHQRRIVENTQAFEQWARARGTKD